MSIFARKPSPIVTGDAACRTMVREGLSGLTPPQRAALLSQHLHATIKDTPDAILADLADLVNSERHERTDP